MAAIMQKDKRETSNEDLRALGFTDEHKIKRNLSTPALYEEIARRNEGIFSEHGALVVDTGEHTGRSAKDKFVVKEASTEQDIWWGEVNKEFAQDKFNQLRDEMIEFAKSKELYVQDLAAGADERYTVAVRVITELAWHSLFARNMFIRDLDTSNATDRFTVINLSSFKANPAKHGTRSETFILLDFSQKLVLIGGTSYAGETKKSIFTILNYILPKRGVMSMHCSANVGVGEHDKGESAIFFGLSGTGKTTLSADPERGLIGDDEHGWSDDGIFNFEGGCYAKVIKLSPDAEPDIYRTTRMFGTVLENVVIDERTRQLDLDSAAKTENTRAAYPLHFIPNFVKEGKAAHPKNIVMLTADAFGVLPPVAKLTSAQAMYHFLSGYTAKVAGTEKGVTEPTATFSTCFGAPFMVHHPGVYADLLGKLIEKHGANCWLVNTGWSGGAYGTGERMKIKYTRAMIHAILNGELSKIETTPDPVFGVGIPASCPDVPNEVLVPRNTWADKAAYDAKAKDLAQRFNDNFQKYADGVSDDIKAAAPKA